MNYVNIIKASCVDFEGWSTVLQLSGCDFRCKGCFNTFAQNPKYGSTLTGGVVQEIEECLKQPFIDNLVIQGGDGMSLFNFQETIVLCRKMKSVLPAKKIVLFTGYTYSELRNDVLRAPILETIDYLMDGRYHQEEPTTKPCRGSDNQVLHSLEGGVSICRS